jgi:hypothetical protein
LEVEQHGGWRSKSPLRRPKRRSCTPTMRGEYNQQSVSVLASHLMNVRPPMRAVLTWEKEAVRSVEALHVSKQSAFNRPPVTEPPRDGASHSPPAHPHGEKKLIRSHTPIPPPPPIREPNTSIPFTKRSTPSRERGVV